MVITSDEMHLAYLGAFCYTTVVILLHRFNYVNDQIGRRVQRADINISAVISNLFAYNTRSELTDAVMGTNQYNYAYDPIGNRRSATNNAEALGYVANSLNQYFQITNNPWTWLEEVLRK